MRRAALLLLLAACLAGCSGEPLLRDYYLGKSILQPSKVSRPVERDALGNAVLTGEARESDADQEN